MLFDLSISIIRGSVKYSELISAIVGTIYFYKYKHTHLKYFLFLLWYITLTEFLGWYIIKYDIIKLLFIDENGVKYNWWLYNLLRFITFNTLFYIYFKSLNDKSFKKWIKIFAFIYNIFYIINWALIQSFFYEMSVMPKVLGSLLLVTIAIFYFIELLKSDKIITYHKKLLFWISIGLILFYTGTIPFSIKISGYALLKGIHNLFLIIWILAILMYLIFAFGFIWSDKEEEVI